MVIRLLHRLIKLFKNKRIKSSKMKGTTQKNPYQTTYTSERDKEKSSKDDVEATWYDELDEDLAALEDEIESLTDELDFYEEQIEESPWGDEDTERDKRRNVRRKRMAHEENHFNHKDETFRQNDTYNEPVKLDPCLGFLTILFSLNSICNEIIPIICNPKTKIMVPPTRSNN